MQIDGRVVGRNSLPFVIAEMSGNHNQSLERAFAIIDAAANAGADAVKLQTYTAATMTLDVTQKDFQIDNPESLWNGESLYSLYQKASTPWEWHEPLFARARERGLSVFSTPFDRLSVDFLENLNVPCYKIASFENTDLPLIRYVASTGKPMIISTGLATISELDETVQAARDAGCKNLVLLKCTSTYPATPANSNVRTIPHLRDLFGCEVGLSDHTLGIGVAVAAVALGATVIEKHFTLGRADGGVDSTFSLEPSELSALVAETKRAWEGLGDVSYGPIDAEKNSMVFRRSLYIAEDMKAGDIFNEKNLRSIRPGKGLSPKYWEMILGKPVKKDAIKGTPLSWDLI